MKALLLCAGTGSRLLPLTKTLPKCLMPIYGKPLLEYWLEILTENHVNEILINTHHLADQVQNFIQKSKFQSYVKLTFEETLLGTGGTLLKNQDFFGNNQDPILLAHADNLTLFHPTHFLNAHFSRPEETEMTLMTFQTQKPSECGILQLDENKVVQKFFEKVKHPPGSLANGAVYILEPTIFSFLKTFNRPVIDFSTEVIPKYLGRMFTYENAVYHRDIGLPESYLEAQMDFPPVYRSFLKNPKMTLETQSSPSSTTKESTSVDFIPQKLPFSFRAAILIETCKPLLISSQLMTPQSLKPGQVLVQIAYSGVCRSQLMETRGARGVDRYVPHLLGHEATGIVRGVGDGVTRLQVGDRVVLGWIKGGGMDVPHCRYSLEDKTVQSGAVSTFSEWSVVSENRCFRLPEAIPMDVGVLLGCALPTGFGMVAHTLKPEHGSSIAIFGLGGIGLSAIMATQLFNCKRIFAIDINPNKLKLAESFGATHVINSQQEDPIQVLRAETDGRGVDYAVEASGNTKTIEQAFSSVRKQGGLCLFASHPPSDERIQIDPHDLISGKKIQGSWGGDSHMEHDLPKFARLYQDGKLPLDRLISQRYSLSQVNQALDDLENNQSLRPLLVMNESLA